MNRATLLACALAMACGPSVSVIDGDDAGHGAADAGHRDAGHRDAGPTCNPPCGPTSTCVDGQCVLVACTDTETRCGALCVDVTSDPDHCGTCSKSCPRSTQGDRVCVAGQCGSHCADDDVDQLCGTTSHCSMGHCCAQNQTWCDGACRSLNSDGTNCGVCGKVCDSAVNATPVCTSGICTLMCDNGYGLCNGACKSFDSDELNCGHCGNQCPSSMACVNGQCTDPVVTCTVEGNDDWTACAGMEATAGMHMTVQASGSWTICVVGCASFGPAGTSTNPGPFSTDGRLDHSANYAALLWRIENGVDHGFTSGTLSTTPTSSGGLQFRINDSELGDNPGAMTITMDYTAQ